MPTLRITLYNVAYKTAEKKKVLSHEFHGGNATFKL